MFGQLGLASENIVGTLHWMKPETSNYFCGYLKYRRMLFVYGDIGEAVYGWSSSIDWAFLAGLELDYFAGKCFASETGRRFRGWDPCKAQKHLDDLLNQDPQIRKRFDRVEEPCYVQRCDWHHWLSQYGNDVFGDSGIGLGEISGIGDCVHIRCHGHLLGIKMAVAQANNKSVDTNLATP